MTHREWFTEEEVREACAEAGIDYDAAFSEEPCTSSQPSPSTEPAP